MGVEMDENIKSNSLANIVNYQEGSVVSRTLGSPHAAPFSKLCSYEA